LKKLKFPFRSNKELALVHGHGFSLLGGWFIADGWRTFLFQGKHHAVCLPGRRGVSQ